MPKRAYKKTFNCQNKHQSPCHLSQPFNWENKLWPICDQIENRLHILQLDVLRQQKVTFSIELLILFQGFNAEAWPERCGHVPLLPQEEHLQRLRLGGHQQGAAQ